MTSRYATSVRKSGMERMLAGVLLIVLSPVMAVCAIAVAAREGMPVLYGSTRIGRHGRPFRLWKFRSMRPEAGRPITAGDDPRITATGRLLRRWKLDELPQLWNVVRGEMGLIGPRPEAPEFVDESSEEWAAILEVTPGITGAASVEFFNEDERLRGVADPVAFYRQHILPEKLAIERRWLSSCSPLGDAGLLLRTARRVAGAGRRPV